LSPAARQRITVGYRMIDATDTEAQPLKKDLHRFGARQPACRALADAQYGIGGLIAVAVWSELGDCRRFSRSEQVVRHTGLDVSVDSSDRRRAGGFLSRQGPQTLRWALYEAAKNSSHLRSPDHDYYAAVKKQHDGKIAAISVAPKLARRCYHVLREVPVDEVYAIPARPSLPAATVGTARSNIRVNRGQLLQPACPPASALDGLQTLTRPRSQPTGVTRSGLLSPTTPASSCT
jgi:Transposase IS116/IS110/IS902 family